ncbi:MAG: YicC family protein [Bacteroidales bacterium]|nr:YicC family protein [Bacteroidales bacterium]
MKSMTGFAKQQCVIGDKKINIEIKTLNSKQLDLNTKMPAAYRSRELEVRTLLGRLERGKVDFIMTEETGTADAATVNTELLAQRYRQISQLAADLKADDPSLLSALLRQPDIWLSDSGDEVGDDDWAVIARGINLAIDQVDAFRSHEGRVLETDFHRHVDLIEQKLLTIPQYEQDRIATARERIQRYFDEFAIKDVDQNRFEQEIIYYLEKLDITEEKVRLQKHIDYFRNVMRDEPSCGKKLAFVAQEMGREINTTGSKANHVEIQKLVVEMKDELEKIKEQLGNIL